MTGPGESGAYGAPLALAFWAENIRPSLGDLPAEGLRYLRNQYVRGVEGNPEAQRQLIEWWTARSAPTEAS